MSPLAFDKQRKPFSWHPRTAKLRVRLFRNPAARGTCCQVLDASGSPLFVEADVEYTAFRRITGNVPGLYRLDQCDEDGVEVDGAPAAYLTIEPLRNGGSLTTETTSPMEVNALAIIERRVAVQERIFASQADVMKQMASQHGVLMNANGAAMHASAEIMRAPYRAPLALPEPRNAGSDDEHTEDDEDREDVEDAPVEPESPFNIAMSFITPEMAHQLGAGAVEKIIEAFRESSARSSPPRLPLPRRRRLLLHSSRRWRPFRRRSASRQTPSPRGRVRGLPRLRRSWSAASSRRTSRGSRTPTASRPA